MSLSKIITYSWLICLFGAGLFPTVLKAQDEEEPEQISTRASLSCMQKNDGVLDLSTLMRARIDGRYSGLPGLEVVFYATTDSSQTELGKAVTNEKGVATITVNAKDIPADTAGVMAFFAEFEGNEEFEDSDDDIEISPAHFVIETTEEDSSLSVQLTLMSNDGPVADEDVSLFVERFFSPLRIGEGTTDEDGTLSIDFPTDLSGDAEGNLQIYAYLDDHSDFGYVKTTATKAWGTPVSDLSEKLPRSLWSPYPPVWMITTFVILMAAVWGHYIVIAVKLNKVKKEGKMLETE